MLRSLCPLGLQRYIFPRYDTIQLSRYDTLHNNKTRKVLPRVLLVGSEVSTADKPTVVLNITLNTAQHGFFAIACSIYDIRIVAQLIAMYRYTGVSLQAYCSHSTHTRNTRNTRARRTPAKAFPFCFQCVYISEFVLGFITTRITLTYILYPQCTHMIFNLISSCSSP